MNKSSSAQQGVVAVYMALVMLMILVSSALIFSSILARQLARAEEVASSEKAFYAANSGLEKALYALAILQVGEDDIEKEGEIPYDDEAAAYKIERAELIEESGVRQPCVVSTGSFRMEVRRVTMGICS